MPEILKLQVQGFRSANGRLAARSPKLAQERRAMLRDVSRGMVRTLQYYAPRRTGIFAEGIAYRTDDRGDKGTATFYVRGQHAFLLPFLVYGTRPHLIPKGGAAEQLAKGYPLHWVDRHGIHHYAWSVWHPGTMPDPFIANAMEAMSPQFEYGLARVARRVAWLA
jgi:hypothetical protein